TPCPNIGRVYIFRSNNNPASGPSNPGSTPAVIQAGRSVTLAASKGNVSKGKKFTLSGAVSSQVDPGGCQAGQAASLDKSKSGTGFTPFASATTDGGGGFSMKVKGKKTFTYQAHMDPTSSCGGANSNTARVKVQKP